MKLKTVLALPDLKILVPGDPGREISGVFCCDLLSIAMGKAPADGVWVTVMGNKNTLAVATLTDTACIVLAEGVTLDQGTLDKAAGEGIAVCATELPVFEAALLIHQAGEA